MGERVQPFPGRVKIILAEPFPSSLGISRQACDSPGHLGEAQAMPQPQRSRTSFPLHPKHNFLGKPGRGLGKPEHLRRLPNLLLEQPEKGGSLFFSFCPFHTPLQSSRQRRPRAWRGARPAEALLKTKRGACMHTHTHGTQPLLHSCRGSAAWKTVSSRLGAQFCALPTGWEPSSMGEAVSRHQDPIIPSPLPRKTSSWHRIPEGQAAGATLSWSMGTCLS